MCTRQEQQKTRKRSCTCTKTTRTYKYLVIKNALAEVSQLEVHGAEEEQVVSPVCSLAVHRLAKSLGILVPFRGGEFVMHEGTRERERERELQAWTDHLQYCCLTSHETMPFVFLSKRLLGCLVVRTLVNATESHLTALKAFDTPFIRESCQTAVPPP